MSKEYIHGIIDKKLDCLTGYAKLFIIIHFENTIEIAIFIGNQNFGEKDIKQKP